ncbi:MAG: DUF664 domain-containing protein [Planctomycetota bacterium]|nr:MAG: DUF664 domain-containing protein [Planctomycetota bacterium]
MPPEHRFEASVLAPPTELERVVVTAGERKAWWPQAPPELSAQADDARGPAFDWTVLGVPSRVEIALTPDGSSTRIRVVHTLARELAVPRAADWLDDFWRLALGNLGAHLRHGVDIALPRLDGQTHGSEASAASEALPAGEASAVNAEISEGAPLVTGGRAPLPSARPIQLALAIEAPPSAVWSALTEPARLERWIASKASIEPRADGAISYGWAYKVGARDVHGGPRRILEWQVERALAYDWPDWRGDPTVRDQRVAWTLEARPGGTRVALEHSGFEREVDWSDFVQGWWEFLLALRREVEQPAAGFALGEAVALLERTPRVLRAWFDGLPSGWLRADEGAATYSPLEIVGHFVHGEETDWVPRTRRILEHGESVPFERYDRFAQRRLHGDRTLAELLALFEQRRAESLAALRALVPSADAAPLDLRGRHPILGAVTLRQLLASWVVHDLSHLRQAARVMAQRYRDEVGPWTEFYPVLGEGPLAKR